MLQVTIKILAGNDYWCGPVAILLLSQMFPNSIMTKVTKEKGEISLE
jgi:hypothetical protein